MSEPSLPPIPFVDLKTQQARIKDDIDRRIQTVLAHGRYIMGPEVAELEKGLAEFCGAKHAIGVSSGTDALLMALMASGVGPGDAVFLPAFTFTASAEIVLLAGATPVFVDVDETYFNIDPADLSQKIADTAQAGKLTPRAIIPVDLFGLPADYDTINRIAAENDMTVIADAAQSFGASQSDRSVGTLAPVTCTSFFPAKPLGCYGDGGALFTDDAELAERCVSIRAHGKGGAKYDIVRIGLNARLDTMQAAILLSKLSIFADELKARQKVADAYDAALSGSVETPARVNSATSAWAQYTVKLDNRDAVAAAMKADGVPTAIYYPLPMHMQSAYTEFGDGTGSLPVSEALSQRVLSLPFHPYLEQDTIDRIADSLNRAIQSA